MSLTRPAVEGDVVIGFVAWSPDREGRSPREERFEVYALYVAPGAWGRGHRYGGAQGARPPER